MTNDSPRRMLVGLIGINIGQSLAPALHEDAFAAAGMTGHYHLMDGEQPRKRTLPELLGAVRAAGFGGIGVTGVAPAPPGRTSGHNTDRSGFRAAFIEAFGSDAARGQPVLLLGAGGA